MEPHAEYDRRLSAVSLVLMDIDGTMVRAAADSVVAILQQLRKLKPLGIRFSIATGRTLYGCKRILTELFSVRMKMPPLIAYNGGVVAWPEDRILTRNVIPNEVFCELVELARSLGIFPLVYTCKETWASNPVESVYSEPNLLHHPERDFNGMPVQWVADLRRLPADDITAVLLAAPHASDEELAADSAAIADKFAGQLRVTCSGGLYIEIAHPLSTKANAMEILARQYDWSAKNIMAIGDNLNDLEMIRAAGFGVAVGNAPSGVKQDADYVCRQNATEGVVEALRFLLSAKRLSKKESMIRFSIGGRRG